MGKYIHKAVKMWQYAMLQWHPHCMYVLVTTELGHYLRKKKYILNKYYKNTCNVLNLAN